MDRHRTAMECLRIEREGGSVLAYLRGIGCVSPWGTWFRLQREELGRNRDQIMDGKGDGDMNHISQEEKARAVEIALSGGDPQAYLEKLGSKNPSAAWCAVKKNLEKNDPEKYAALTEMKRPVATCCARSTRKGAEVPDVIPDEPIPLEPVAAEPAKARPLNYAGFDVTGVRAEYGEFRLSNNGYLYFGANDHDELEMPVEVWRKFAADLPMVMGILGIPH